MAGVQRARIVTKGCPMSDDTCAAKVIAHITGLYPQPFDATQMVEEKCGRYVRGKSVGKLRGWAQIDVVVEGGWKKYGPGEGNGRVLRPGTITAVRIVDTFSNKIYLEA